MSRFVADLRRGNVELYVDSGVGVFLMEIRVGEVHCRHFQSFDALDHRASYYSLTKLAIERPSPGELRSDYDDPDPLVAPVQTGNMLLRVRDGQRVVYPSAALLERAKIEGAKNNIFHYQTGEAIDFVFRYQNRRLVLLAVDTVGMGPI